MTKDDIRSEMKAKRRALSLSEQLEMSNCITNNFLSLDCYKKSSVVMVYMSAFKEPSTAAIIDSLKRDNKKIIVPISNMENFTITPSYLSENLVSGAYSIAEPQKCIPADINDIDLALIPGIAFDAKGARIGFGKGYYDRFLSEFKGLKIGLCYNFQVFSDIPVSEHDIKMDMIITEKRIYNDF